MFAAIAMLLLAAQAPQPARPEPELPVIDARLGPCVADFRVTDSDGLPIYNATIQVRIRYGFMSLKRMDLEVGTNGDGKARVAGLPEKARPLAYNVTKGDKKSSVDHDLDASCQASFEVPLK